MAFIFYFNGKLRYVTGRSKMKTRFFCLFPMAFGAVMIGVFQLLWFLYDMYLVTTSEDGWDPSWDLFAYLFPEVHKLNAFICLTVGAVMPPTVLCCPKMMKIDENEEVIDLSNPNLTSYQELKALRRETKNLLKQQALRRSRSASEALFTIANVSLIVVYIGYVTNILFHVVMWSAGWLGLTPDSTPWEPTDEERTTMIGAMIFFGIYNYWQVATIPSVITSLSFMKRTGLSGWTYESAIEKQRQLYKEALENHEGFQKLSELRRGANMLENYNMDKLHQQHSREGSKEVHPKWFKMGKQDRHMQRENHMINHHANQKAEMAALMDNHGIGDGHKGRIVRDAMLMNNIGQKGGWEDRVRADNAEKKQKKKDDKNNHKEEKNHLKARRKSYKKKQSIKPV